MTCDFFVSFTIKAFFSSERATKILSGLKTMREYFLIKKQS